MAAIAVIVPNTTFPLVTLVSLVAAAAAGYLAPSRRHIVPIAVATIIASFVVWARPGGFENGGSQWLAATISLSAATAAVAYYVRVLEHRVFELDWQAGLSAEIADLGLFQWDAVTDRLDGNARFREIYGFRADQPLIGEEAFSAIHPDDVDGVREKVGAALVDGATYNSDFRIRRRDGTVRWVKASGRLLVNPYSGKRRLAGVNVDVTADKEREALISRLIDGVDALFAIADGEGKLLELNAYGKAKSGDVAGAWKSQPFWDLDLWAFSEENRTAVKAIVQSARERNVRTSGEAPFRNPGGDMGAAAITVTPINAAFSGENYICICAMDISESKAAAESNAMMVVELRHRIKNLLAVTNALINLSARYSTSVEEFAAATRSRLAAINAAHNIGARDLRRRSAMLRDIIDVTLKPLRIDHRRLSIEACDVELDAGAATAWALMIHELAANCARSGSLSGMNGWLEIYCAESDGAVVFEWRERFDGAAPPLATSSFAKTITEQLAESFLGGSLERRDEGTMRVTRMVMRNNNQGSRP